MKICMDFRKMIHGEENAQTMDEWLKEAEACPLKEISGFAKYIRKDRNAVEQTCRTAFNNGLLEGTVNKAKAFKRNMFNKAGPAVLRAKLLYAD
jgi:transposase